VSIPLDPIEATAIGPGLAAISLAPTVWDDLPDGQHALTPDGVVWQRRRGLWWPSPWWQLEDAEQIKATCADPDSWAYASGWPRKMIEDAHGPLEPITLPSDGYPHADDRCRQDSVDAAGFTEACRQVSRLADALGMADAAQSIDEVIDTAIARLASP
jgi:hypothetical protein